MAADDYSEFAPVATAEPPPSPPGVDSSSAGTSQADDYSGFTPVSQPDSSDDYSEFQQYQGQLIGSVEGNATTFADPGDLARYRIAKANGATEQQALAVGDNGKGHPSLGGIDTPNAYGVAVPQEYLQAAFGNDPAAWRRARAEVTSNGQSIRVPFVDLGPGAGPRSKGVVADFTNPLATVLGSNGMARAHVKFIAEGGADYLKDPQAWMAEQSKLGGGAPSTTQPSSQAAPGQDDYSAFTPVQSQDDYSAFTPVTPAATPAAPRALPSQGDPRAQLVDAGGGGGYDQSAAMPRVTPRAQSATSSYEQSADAVPASAPEGEQSDVYKFGQQVVGSARQTLAEIEKGRSEDLLNNPPPAYTGGQQGNPADPNDYATSHQQELDAARAADIAAAQKNLPAQTAELTASKSALDATYGQTVPGKIASTIGGLAPIVGAGVVGGPLTGAMLASANIGSQTYGQVHDDSLAKLTAQGLPPQEAQRKANQLADDASRVAEIVGGALAVSGIDIPITSLIPRIAARVALTGSVQSAAAAIMQELENQGYVRAGLPPSGDVGQAAVQGAVLGGVVGGIHGVMDRGPVPAYMQEQAPRTPAEEQTATEAQKAYQQKTGQVPPEQAAPQPQPAPEPPRPPSEPPTPPADALSQAINQRRGATPPGSSDFDRLIGANVGERPMAAATASAPDIPSPDEVDAQKRNDDIYEKLKAQSQILHPQAASAAPEIQDAGTTFHAGLPIPGLSEKGRIVIAQGLRAFKGGEDYMNDYNETQPLALAERRRFSLNQESAAAANIPEVLRAAKAVTNWKGEVDPRVIKEFTDYTRAEQNGQPLPQVSADTLNLIQKMKDSFEQLGKQLTDVGMKVQQSDGKIRAGNYTIGRSYFPRMISADTHDIFNERNGSRKADFDALVNKMIAKGEVQSRAEFEDRFIRGTPSDRTSSEIFNNVERARELKLPLEFYDMSPETGLRYLARAPERIAQVRAFGQAIGGAKDLFERSIQDVENSSRPYTQKRWIVDRIKQDRSAEYNEYARGEFRTVLGKAQQLTTGAFIGNPASSFKYLATGQMQNLAYGGPIRFLRTLLGGAVNPRGVLMALRDAEDRNIFRNQLANVIHDFSATKPGFAHAFTQAQLHVFGHNWADRMNRTFGMVVAKSQLADLSRMYPMRQDAVARNLYDSIKRTGITDLHALAAEKGVGPLSDEFIRQRVGDIHGNYTYSQSPSWQQGPVGRVAFQFARWGMNSARVYTHDFIMPLAKSVQSGDASGIAYHVMRNLAALAAGTVVSGEAIQAFKQYVLGTSPNDPSWEEIGNSIMKGRYQEGLLRFFARAKDDLILGGLLGSIGDLAQFGQSITNPAGTKNFHNPLVPPGLGIPTAIGSFLQGWMGENGFRGLPSLKLLQNLLDTESGYRTTRQMAMQASNALHLPWQQAKEQGARNELSWLRQREDMFVQDNPMYKSKTNQLGTKSSTSAGRTEYDPYRDRIIGALLTGDSAGAQQAAREYLNTFPLAQRAAKQKSLRESVTSSNPLKPGGSSSATAQSDFLKWSRGHLPADEVNRILALSRNYARAADRAGFAVRVPQ